MYISQTFTKYSPGLVSNTGAETFNLLVLIKCVVFEDFSIATILI